MVVGLKKIIFILLIFVFLLFLFKIGFFNFLDGIFRPVLIGLNERGSKLNSFFIPLINKKNLLSKIKDLENKVLQLQAENINLKLQAEENKFLRNQLKFLKFQKFNFILANIIGQRSEVGYNWYIIDRGADDGLKDGAAVIVNDGYLVGKIMKIEKNFSYFVPIFNDHFLTSVDFLAKNVTSTPKMSMISGLAKGRYNLALEVDFIPIEKTVAIGDNVITSGMEEGIPRGLIVGQVENVEKKIDIPFQKAIIKPLISLEDIKIVTVIIP